MTATEKINSLTVIEKAAPPAQASNAVISVDDAGSILAVIAKVASDPAVDIARIERLTDLYERIKGRNAKAAYDAALAEMQAELPVIDRRGKIEVREKDAVGKRTGPVQQSTSYALWEDINEAIKPALAKHGFSLSFRTGLAGDGRIMVTGILAHRGHREETTMTLPHDSTGSKNSVQAIGSSTSYGKRYVAGALLNLTSRGQDDDGNAAGAASAPAEEPGHLSDAQLAELRHLLKSTGGDEKRLCAHLDVPGLENIFAKRFETVKQIIQAAGDKRKAQLIEKAKEMK